MKSKYNFALVIALSATVAACDPGEELTQRDVYHTLEDCVADWGNVELCEKQIADAKAEQAKAASHNNGGTGNAIVPIIFFGPTYHGNDRYVAHNGQTYAPTTTRANSTAQFRPSSSRPVSYGNAVPAAKSVSPSPSAVVGSGSRSSGVTTTGSTSRGGFGGTGSSSGG